MLELNVSCPQMACEGAGHKVGQDTELLERYTRLVKEHVSIPVMVKLTPNVTDMLPAALACERGGADALSTINTVRGISEVDLQTFAPKPTIQGRGSISGFSGTAVKPIAMRFVAELCQSRQVALPVSGIGGIETWQDAAMFLLLGASNLQVTSAVMHYGYRIVESMREGLEDYLETLGYRSVVELVGAGLPFVIDPAEHIQTAHVVAKVDPDKCIRCGLCHVLLGRRQPGHGVRCHGAQGQGGRGTLRRLPALPARLPGVGLRGHRGGPGPGYLGHAPRRHGLRPSRVMLLR